MKTNFAAVVAMMSCFLTTISMAAPAVGDYALSKLTNRSSSQTSDFWIETTLVEYNQATDQFKQRVIRKERGELSTVSEEWVPRSALQYTNVPLEKCDPRLVLDEVDVPAGKFQACRAGVEGIFFWSGNVPFGLIKFESPRYCDELGCTSNLWELVDYKFGKGN